MATILLLHAGVADRTMWSEHVGPLEAAGHRVIAPDLPGFAAEPPSGAPWEEVAALLDEPAVVVGNSWGGAVALRVAAVAPERVAGLFLVSPLPPDLEPSEELEAAWAEEEEAFDRGDLDAATEAVAQAWTRPGPVRERVREMQRRTFELQRDLPDPPEADDPLGDLAVPALVVSGAHDWPEFRAGAERLAASLGAEHIVIAEAGHLAPLETPERFRSLLVGFLDQAPPR